MDSPRNIDQIAGDWLARRDSGDWSGADQMRLEEWLEESVLHRVTYLRLEHVWERSQRLRALGTGKPDGGPPPPGAWVFSPFFDPHPAQAAVRNPDHFKPAVSRRPSRILWAGGSAAACVLLAVLLAVSWNLGSRGASYRTPVGGIALIPLADGSKVTLNTDSRIHVSVTDHERRVELEQGEAYFEVAQDTRRPFVVRAGDKRVIAVGTRFSVRRNGDDVDVIVTEGRVRLEGAPVAQLQKSAPELLSAGMVARAGDSGVLLENGTPTEAEESLSWREGVLVFREMTLAQAVAEFNRYNTRKIVIADPHAADFRVAGSFRADNVDAFLRLIERGYPLRVERHEDRYILQAR
ncbi:MAG: FecR domain-containing protein [Proteobacteria bacterium]|nr:FecR domain-containing protein [Pseudomonadota bacterium]